MSSIKHIDYNFFESRLKFSKFENPHPEAKEGVREYNNSIIRFFAVLFGFAVDVTYKGQIFCLNKNSFQNWVKRNFENAPIIDSIQTQAPRLIAEVNLPSRFAALKSDVEQLNEKPPFIRALCDQKPTVETYRDLKEWRKARDILIVWSVLAKCINADDP